MEIYLDNTATTHYDTRVIETMVPFYSELYGNASSIHKAGKRPAEAIEQARQIIAGKIHCKPDEIYFTSGGTESNNWALKGVFYSNKQKGNHIITTSIEHPSILETANWLGEHKAKITLIPVNNQGFVDVDDIRKAIRNDTVLISVMHANNEIGTIEPIGSIGTLCREKGILFHTDACQSFTKETIDTEEQYIDLMTLNAHKIHGPKGVGALYIRKGSRCEAFIHGGGQENNMRSGTYNTPDIAGFGKAAEIASEEDVQKMSLLRDFFISEVSSKLEGVFLNGPVGGKRLCNNINLRFSKVKGKSLFTELNKRNIIISAGSACSSTRLTPSHVLTALGLDEESAHEGVRISLSKWTNKEELDYVIHHIIDIVDDLRKK